MSILDQLCDDFIDGKLSLKPPTADELQEYRLGEIEEKFGITEEQVNEFERIFFEMRTDDERLFFAAGFKTAMYIFFE